MSKTGGSNDYYALEVRNTLDGREAFTVQCLEIIETLGMTFAEGEAFKAIWRTCAARTLGKEKPGNTALYDAEKVQFYGGRIVAACVWRPGESVLVESASLPDGFHEYSQGQALPAPHLPSDLAYDGHD